MDVHWRIVLCTGASIMQGGTVLGTWHMNHVPQRGDSLTVPSHAAMAPTAEFPLGCRRFTILALEHHIALSSEVSIYVRPVRREDVQIPRGADTGTPA